MYVCVSSDPISITLSPKCLSAGEGVTGGGVISIIASGLLQTCVWNDPLFHAGIYNK